MDGASARDDANNDIANDSIFSFPIDLRAGRLTIGLRRLTSPNGQTVPLTNSKFNLLAAFLASPQRALSRQQLLDLSGLHNDEVYDRSIDVQVGRLRRKLAVAHSHDELIRTERGAGYMFTADVETVR